VSQGRGRASLRLNFFLPWSYQSGRRRVDMLVYRVRQRVPQPRFFIRLSNWGPRAFDLQRRFGGGHTIPFEPR